MIESERDPRSPCGIHLYARGAARCGRCAEALAELRGEAPPPPKRNRAPLPSPRARRVQSALIRGGLLAPIEAAALPPPPEGWRAEAS